MKSRSMVALVAGLTVGFASLYANAALVTETAGGVGVVYDSVNNVTWTQNANILGTMEGGAAPQSDAWYAVVNKVIAASGGKVWSLDRSTMLNVTAFDFGEMGTVNFLGAEAFTAYLNSVDYGGSSHWRLPTLQAYYDPGTDLAPLGMAEFAHLFYDELGGTLDSPMPVGPFTNVGGPGAYNQYWTDIENFLRLGGGSYTSTGELFGFDADNGRWYSGGGELAWLVTDGALPADPNGGGGTNIPEPGTLLLSMSAMGALLAMRRRRTRELERQVSTIPAL